MRCPVGTIIFIVALAPLNTLQFVWLGLVVGQAYLLTSQFDVTFLDMLRKWRAVAIAASAVSLIVSVLYIQGPAFNAAAADVIILVALLIAHWPPADLVGL